MKIQTLPKNEAVGTLSVSQKLGRIFSACPGLFPFSLHNTLFEKVGSLKF
jgi:hypothetical protein